MAKKKKQTGKKFEMFARRLASAGFVEMLEFVRRNENARYNEIKNYLLDEQKLFTARSSANLLINHLLELGLIERKVLDTKPLKTSYRISRKGESVLKHLKVIERVLGK